MTTIGQAYACIFAHYYAGPILDGRVLLASAFAGLAQQLDRLGLDQPGATLPARKAVRQQVAEATMNGMIAALGDSHAGWLYPQLPKASPPSGRARPA